MGLTQHSIELMFPYLKTDISVLELGAQNLYGDYKYGAYASEYYQERFNASYKCIDLNGENEALKIDLSQPVHLDQLFDVITDFGTSEHVGRTPLDWKAIYNCWKTKHILCVTGGYIISENPKTGNWPGHGFNYYTQEFYKELAEAMGYELKEIGEHAAMGNTTDGWNVYSVLRKVEDKPFMSLSQFKKLSLKPC